jgi:hypothetical protein
MNSKTMIVAIAFGLISYAHQGQSAELPIEQISINYAHATPRDIYQLLLQSGGSKAADGSVKATVKTQDGKPLDISVKPNGGIETAKISLTNAIITSVAPGPTQVPVTTQNGAGFDLIVKKEPSGIGLLLPAIQKVHNAPTGGGGGGGKVHVHDITITR